MDIFISVYLAIGLVFAFAFIEKFKGKEAEFYAIQEAEMGSRTRIWQHAAWMVLVWPFVVASLILDGWGNP